MSEPSAQGLVCFEAFAWPLPECFAAAVASCRFELGDVLYRDAAAYAPWNGRVPGGATAIQVLDPPRSTRATPREGEADRRRANWASEVRVALIDPGSGESQERVLTQGKLLMALWHGDEAWLEGDRDPPEFPKTARDLHAELEAARPACTNRLLRGRALEGSLFILVVDLASDASRAKAALVEAQLRRSGAVEVADLRPADADLEDAARFHPTLVLRSFLLPGRDTSAVEAELRTSLYRGSSTAAEPTRDVETGDREATGKDRFSIARHGLLCAIEIS